MALGARQINIKSKIASRLSPARYLRHNLGLKAPQGFGWITDPRRALYSRVYTRVTFKPSDIARLIMKRMSSVSSPPSRRRGGSRTRGLIESIPGGKSLSKRIYGGQGRPRRRSTRSPGGSGKGRGRPKSASRKTERGEGGFRVQPGLNSSQKVKKAWRVRKRKYGPSGRGSARSFKRAGRTMRGQRRRGYSR